VDNIETSPLSLADMKATMTGAATGPTDIFSYSFMQLCGLSYEANPADIPALVKNPANVSTWGPGRWACVWGPVLDSEQANLVYVAAYYDGPTGLPVAAVTVIRGTDVTDNVWGDMWEAFEDLDVALQYPMPWAPWLPARVAGGTLDALTTIQSLLSSGATLVEFLASFLGNPANQNPVLAVTGHSLGGCLASVAAPWLRVALAGRGVTAWIVPTTFAAPTAGNAAFASYLGETFDYAPRYYNNLDMVPHGWADLEGVKTLYDEYGLATPFTVKGAVDVMEGLIYEGGASYAQPANAGTLAGTFCMGFTWYQQISVQHDHRNYIALMGGQNPICYTSLRLSNRHHAPEEREAALGEVQEQAADCEPPRPA
jgi:triacylglycerol lipase